MVCCRSHSLISQNRTHKASIGNKIYQFSSVALNLLQIYIYHGSRFYCRVKDVIMFTSGDNVYITAYLAHMQLRLGYMCQLQKQQYYLLYVNLYFQKKTLSPVCFIRVLWYRSSLFVYLIDFIVACHQRYDIRAHFPECRMQLMRS